MVMTFLPTVIMLWLFGLSLTLSRNGTRLRSGGDRFLRDHARAGRGPTKAPRGTLVHLTDPAVECHHVVAAFPVEARGLRPHALDRALVTTARTLDGAMAQAGVRERARKLVLQALHGFDGEKRGRHIDPVLRTERREAVPPVLRVGDATPERDERHDDDRDRQPPRP